VFRFGCLDAHLASGHILKGNIRAADAEFGLGDEMSLGIRSFCYGSYVQSATIFEIAKSGVVPHHSAPWNA
jgi:hypothetical protein